MPGKKNVPKSGETGSGNTFYSSLWITFMLAALVAYGARSLTCGLAGCLALTASTFFYSVL